MGETDVLKPHFWMGTSLKDLRSFPEAVKETIGYGLYLAQKGGKHQHAKPLREFRGAGVLELMEDHDGETYRAVYTVKLAGAVYVLHAFPKKSKAGIATPKHVMDLVYERLRAAQVLNAELNE